MIFSPSYWFCRYCALANGDFIESKASYVTLGIVMELLKYALSNKTR